MDEQAVLDAAERIAGEVHRTPVLRSSTLDEATGAQVFLKAESFQKTGSFKARGALNRVLTLSDDALDKGLIAVSAGNHAAAVAWAARSAGVSATVVMPLDATASKVAACRAYGADVVLHGESTTEAFAEAARIQQNDGQTFVHPFDDLEVVAGQGTAGLELVQEAGPFDVLLACIGGGGLICGMATAVKAANPGCRVVGVEPEGAAALSAALDAGEPVGITPHSIADGLCAPFAGPLTFPLFQELVDEVVLVSDDELLRAVRFVMERMKVVVEPAGAAAVAALRAGRLGDLSGARVGTILSGGNVDLARIAPLFPPAREAEAPARQ